MNERPIFHFDDLSSTGIDKVPVGAKVLITDFSNGHPLEVIKIGMGTLTSASNIAEFIADISLYVRTGIQNNTTGTSGVVHEIWTGTQAEYDSLVDKIPTVLYFIRE